MISTFTFALARLIAANKPAGPAPTITADLTLFLFSRTKSSSLNSDTLCLSFLIILGLSFVSINT